MTLPIPARKSVFFKFLFDYKKHIGILLLLSLCSSLSILAVPYLSKFFVDGAFLEKDFGKFRDLSILGAFLFFFSVSFKAAEGALKNRLSVKLKLSLANRFIRKFYSLDFGFLQSKSKGESVFRLYDLETLTALILEQCPVFLADCVKLFFILGICLRLNFQMTVVLVLLSPVFIFHSSYLQKKLEPIYEQIWRASALAYKKLEESFSGILIVKAFGLESYQRNAYIKSLIENLRWVVKSFRLSMFSSLTFSFLSKAAYGAVALYGGWLIIKGRMTLGSYAAIMLYITQLSGVMESLSLNFAYFSREAVSFNKFLEIMDVSSKIKDSPQAKTPNFLNGEIRFENICFGYEGRRVLNGLNFKIPASSWIGIAGPSGSGKTTLVNLILRLYDPLEGNIFFDKLELREIRLKFLRKNMAVATQEPFLFDVPIRENICCGRKGVSRQRLIEAAELACIYDFIAGLPEGFDTVVGEAGYRLSQGLKQRMSLARAILTNPAVLILDEATSSVDSLTEEKIFKGLRHNRQGLTTIVISHRLSCVKGADRVYFLKMAGPLEEGTHEQLLSNSVEYKGFFHNQQSSIL